MRITRGNPEVHSLVSAQHLTRDKIRRLAGKVNTFFKIAVLGPLYLSGAMGICNLRNVICDNLTSVLTELKGRNKELEAKFSAEIQAIKNLVIKFVGSLVNQLQKEMGMDASDYNLDDHDISHVFEHWMEGADLNNLTSPESKARLIELLQQEIGISKDDARYSQILKEQLDDPDFLSRLAQMARDLNEKAQKFAAENPHKNGSANGSSQADNQAILEAASQAAGKARGGRN